MSLEPRPNRAHEGQIINAGLDPDRIARHLSSEAVPMKDLIIRNGKTREVVKRIHRWEITLSRPDLPTKTSVIISPDEKEVVVLVVKPPESTIHNIHLNDVNKVEYSQGGGYVSFVKETERFKYELGVNDGGGINSFLFEKKEYVDDGTVLDTTNLS